MDTERPSPLTNACRRKGQIARDHIAINQRMIDAMGQTRNRALHRQMGGAQNVQRINLCHRGMRNRHIGTLKISAYNASRFFALNFLESFRPSGMRAGSKTTAAAVTGPANGPRAPPHPHPPHGRQSLSRTQNQARRHPPSSRKINLRRRPQIPKEFKTSRGSIAASFNQSE